MLTNWSNVNILVVKKSANFQSYASLFSLYCVFFTIEHQIMVKWMSIKFVTNDQFHKRLVSLDLSFCMFSVYMTYSLAKPGHTFKHSHKTDAAGQPSSLVVQKCLKWYWTSLQVLSTLHCFELPILFLNYYHSCHWIWQLYWKEPKLFCIKQSFTNRKQ